jgi:hypothetical protein
MQYKIKVTQYSDRVVHAVVLLPTNWLSDKTTNSGLSIFACRFV